MIWDTGATANPKCKNWNVNFSPYLYYMILTNTSPEKFELNTLDCYGDLEHLDSKGISQLLITAFQFFKISDTCMKNSP